MAIFVVDRSVCSFDRSYHEFIPDINDYKEPRISVATINLLIQSAPALIGINPPWNPDNVAFRYVPLRVEVGTGSFKYSYCFLAYNLESQPLKDSVSQVIRDAKIGVIVCPGGLIRESDGRQLVLKNAQEIVDFCNTPEGFPGQ